MKKIFFPLYISLIFLNFSCGNEDGKEKAGQTELYLNDFDWKEKDPPTFNKETRKALIKGHIKSTKQVHIDFIVQNLKGNSINQKDEGFKVYYKRPSSKKLDFSLGDLGAYLSVGTKVCNGTYNLKVLVRSGNLQKKTKYLPFTVTDALPSEQCEPEIRTVVLFNRQNKDAKGFNLQNNTDTHLREEADIIDLTQEGQDFSKRLGSETGAKFVQNPTLHFDKATRENALEVYKNLDEGSSETQELQENELVLLYIPKSDSFYLLKILKINMNEYASKDGKPIIGSMGLMIRKLKK